MNISKLFRRAHALRMQCSVTGDATAPSEFYVGAVIGERIVDTKNANGEVLIPRSQEIKMITKTIRRFAEDPVALRKALLVRLNWPEDMAGIWEYLLFCYSREPEILRAIADGMEAS